MHVAVVTRTKDRELLLARCRKSLSEQKNTSFVWSIVNDGGERTYVEREAQQARAAGIETVVTHLSENIGRAGAANAGVFAVSCDAVVLVDDDDRLLVDGLAKLVDALEAAPPSDVGVAAQVWQVTESLTKSGWVEKSRVISNPERGPVKIVDLAYRNFVPVCGLIFRRSIFDMLSGFDETLPVVEDWDFLLRAIQIGDISKINTLVAEYFVRPDITDFRDSYANSVAGGHSLHEEWEARIRNRYLRADIAAGNHGMGALMNPSHRLPMERINMLAAKINALPQKSWIARKILNWVRK